MTRPRFVAALLALACLPLGCKRADKPAEAEKAPPAPVKWEGPRQVVLEEWAELLGSTEPLPLHAARVTTPVEGQVLAVLDAAAGKPVAEGQLVAKGDVLVKLDPTHVLILQDKAEGAKKVLQAEKEVAELTVKQAELEVRRLTELKRRSDAQPPGSLPLLSAIELDKATVALDSARAGVRAAERKLEAADKELESLKLQLAQYTLTAPRAGRLGRLQVVTGQTLAVGAVVAEVVDVKDEIDVLCFVPPSVARRLKVGLPAHFGGVEKGPAAESTADPEGHVAFLADHAEADTGSFAVKVRFPNGDLKLPANAVVRVRVQTQPGRACWAVPESALIEDQEPPGIVVVEEVETRKNADGKDEQAGKARRLRAVLGVRDRVLHQVEVVRLEDPEKKWKGDLEHALVVVEKGQGVQTGDAVRLEEEEEEEPAKPEEKKE
jgi:RND family efflux transporter MFP subunit